MYLFKTIMKQILLFLLFLTLSACSSVTDTKDPDFLNLKPEFSIVLGYINKTEYLPEIESQCAKGHICISLDPPPLKLNIVVEDVIYGDMQSKSVTAYTTSHYGLSTYPEDVYYLFMLKTNGKEIIIPRYSPKEIALDIDEQPTLPMFSIDDIPEWIQCNISHLNKMIEYDGSYEHVLYAIEDFTPEELKEMESFAVISEYSVRIVRGIYLSDIKRYLSKQSC
ncbi:hypothetical protein N474_01970 [Pseudoalteromonas luteoviolacea CPMOR-2]|nr:hypothetical protein N474_01970 [Pseudoalteromonas luteoviolacea CPMOR-2]